MPTKEHELIQRIALVLKDLQTAGLRDYEAVTYIGRLGARLTKQKKLQTWAGVKASLSKANVDSLLEDFRTEGNKLIQQGEQKAAYAVQIYALSLAARTVDGETLKQGEELLDQIIDRTLAFYRENAKPDAVSADPTKH